MNMEQLNKMDDNNNDELSKYGLKKRTFFEYNDNNKNDNKNDNNNDDNNDNDKKKYKKNDIILVNDEYCVNFETFDETEIFTRYYAQYKCPLCEKRMSDCIGFYEDFNKMISNNEINLNNIFKHLRKDHVEEFISINNIHSNVSKKNMKFTLVKKIIL